MPRKPTEPQLLPVDMEYLQTVLVDLLDIPSPSGRTDHVTQYVGERLEELGLLTPEVAEIVSIDAAVVAPGQQSRERSATVAMGDGVGPFDFHLTRKLTSLADEHKLDVVRDVFDHYRSDVAAAPEAGAHARVALLGFGVDATHGHERTHLAGLEALSRLVALYLQSDLVFPEWDAEPEGELAKFPSLAVQPAGEEGPQEGPIGLS